jgi:hypothetical protein
MTYTYAILDVSRATYEEVALLLRAAGYDHCFDRDVIDMHGIALRIGEENAEETRDQRGAGPGVFRDGAIRRGGAGAAAGGPSGEDARPEGAGEGQEKGSGGGQQGGRRGDAVVRWPGSGTLVGWDLASGADGTGPACVPQGEAPERGQPDDSGEPTGGGDDGGGPDGTD